MSELLITYQFVGVVTMQKFKWQSRDIYHSLPPPIRKSFLRLCIWYNMLFITIQNIMRSEGVLPLVIMVSIFVVFSESSVIDAGAEFESTHSI